MWRCQQLLATWVLAPAASIWVVNAYQLALVISLLPLSSLGDIVGYRKIYQAGFAVFTVASLCCALSHSLLSLACARFIQGLGAAGIVSVNTALIRTIHPARTLGRGLGINAMVVAVSAAIGPTLAAAILSVAPWPWLFAVNVPVGILGLGISLRTLPRTGGSGHRFDLKSAVLSALTFGLLISGIDGLGHGQAAWAAAVEITAAIFIGIVFVRRQLSQPAPLFAVDLLRRPIFALSVATSVCSFTAQMLAYVSLPFYLQNVLGRTQVESGLLISPWPLATLIAAPIAGYLADRYSAGILGGMGLGDVYRWTGIAGAAIASSGLHLHYLENGAVRSGLWVLSGTKQPRDSFCCAKGEERRGKRHAGNCPRDGPDPWSGACRTDLQYVSPAPATPWRWW